jgi:hypothetical protein
MLVYTTQDIALGTAAKYKWMRLGTHQATSSKEALKKLVYDLLHHINTVIHGTDKW